MELLVVKPSKTGSQESRIKGGSTGIALLTGGSGKVMDKDPGSEGPDPGNVVYKTRRIRDPDPGNGVYGSGGSEPGSG